LDIERSHGAAGLGAAAFPYLGRKVVNDVRAP